MPSPVKNNTQDPIPPAPVPNDPSSNPFVQSYLKLPNISAMNEFQRDLRSTSPSPDSSPEAEVIRSIIEGIYSLEEKFLRVAVHSLNTNLHYVESIPAAIQSGESVLLRDCGMDIIFNKTIQSKLKIRQFYNVPLFKTIDELFASIERVNDGAELEISSFAKPKLAAASLAGLAKARSTVTIDGSQWYRGNIPNPILGITIFMKACNADITPSIAINIMGDTGGILYFTINGKSLTVTREESGILKNLLPASRKTAIQLLAKYSSQIISWANSVLDRVPGATDHPIGAAERKPKAGDLA